MRKENDSGSTCALATLGDLTQLDALLFLS
jgi:hypothetical protein